MTGHTSYTFAQSAGLDVTKVHRLVNGSQLPSPEFLHIFCDSLRINEAERRELFELYEEETTGHAIYQNRRYIAQMISALATGESLPIPFSDAGADSGNKTQTHLLLCDVLADAFSQPAPSCEIYCNFPVDFPFPFFGLLMHICRKYARQKKISFYHLITFSSNPAIQPDSNCNLKILHQIFPLVFSDFGVYLPYYYYTHASASDFFQIPWPYYLVTEQAVLLLSSDGSTAIIHREPEKISRYRQEMKHLLQIAMPLICRSTSAEESLALYSRHSWPSNPILGYLAYQPCIMSCITTERFIKSFSGQTFPPELLDLLPSSGFCLPAMKASSYFSREGLLHFWKTGQVSGQLAEYLPPFSPEERRETLSNFVQQNNGKEESSRMITLDIQFPSRFYIELLSNHRLLICSFEKECNLRFVLLDESSIYDAFTDFFQYLGTGERSLSVPETNRFIMNLLENSEPGGNYYV